MINHHDTIFAEIPGSFSSQMYQDLQKEMIAYTVGESFTDNYNLFYH